MCKLYTNAGDNCKKITANEQGWILLRASVLPEVISLQRFAHDNPPNFAPV